MFVYIVSFAEECEDCWVERVFDSEEKAVNFLKEYGLISESSDDSYQCWVKPENDTTPAYMPDKAYIETFEVE